MPLKNVRYRVVQSSKGPVRLAFRGKGKVVEAKNLKTGAVHTPDEFAFKKSHKSSHKRKSRISEGGSIRY